MRLVQISVPVLISNILFTNALCILPALQVGERTKTAEELAEAEAARLQALEASRLKRMHASGGDDDGKDGDAVADGAPLAAGGYAARRQKRQRREAAATVAAGPSGAPWLHVLACNILCELELGLLAALAGEFASDNT